MSKLKIDTARLKTVLGHVSPAIEHRASNVLSSSYLVDVYSDKISVRANNSEVAAQYIYDGAFEFDGEPVRFCVDGFIADIVNNAKGKTTIFEFDGEAIIMKIGRSKHKIAKQDHSKFPSAMEIPADDNLVEIPVDKIPQFVNVYKNLLFAVSNDMDWKILHTIKTAADGFVATNMAQAVFLTADNIPGDNENETKESPYKFVTDNIGLACPPAVKLLACLKPADEIKPAGDEIAIRDQMFVLFDMQTIYLKYVTAFGILDYHIAIIDGTYPETITQALEATEAENCIFELVVSKEEFESALTECMLYYTKGHTGDIQYFTIRVETKQDEVGEADTVVKFESEIPTIAELKHDVEIISLATPAEFEFHMDPKEVGDAMHLFTGDLKICMFENKPKAVIIYDTKNPNLKYFQRTMNKEKAE